MRLFLLATAIVALLALWISSGAVPWLLITVVSVSVGIGLLWSNLPIGARYLQTEESGMALRMVGISRIPYANIRGVDLQDNEVRIHFKQRVGIPVWPLKIPRDSIAFAVDDAESLVDLLNSHIEPQASSSA